jgi:TRAP-type C4-dicarboxylate transport system substrate-binding protein
MGGVPVPLPIYEVNEALARGVIDGTQTYIYASHAYKLHEQCKFQPLNGISHIFVEYVINKDVLAKMPEELRKIYLETWRSFYPERLAKYTDEEFDQQIKDFKAAGVSLYTIPAEEIAGWKKIAEPLYEEYFQAMNKEGVDGKAVLEQYQALYRKYERKK